MTKFAHPRLPYDRSPDYGFAPKSMDHVKPLGWIEVVVGDGYNYVDNDMRNLVFAIVVGFSETGTIYAVVADETQYTDLTGIEDGDVLELELADIAESEFSPAQQAVEMTCEMDEIESQIFNAQRDEFNRWYPEYSDAARREHNRNDPPG